MEERIIQMISDIKKDPGLVHKLTGASSILHESGMESLQIVHFILQVEDEFGVQIDFDEFDMNHLDSIDHFCAYIRQNNPAFSESVNS